MKVYAVVPEGVPGTTAGRSFRVVVERKDTRTGAEGFEFIEGKKCFFSTWKNSPYIEGMDWIRKEVL